MGNNKSFILGALAVLVGIALEKLSRACTIQSARDLKNLYREDSPRYKSPQDMPPPQAHKYIDESEFPFEENPGDYTMSPPPPSVDDFKMGAPVSITSSDEDFYEMINDTAKDGGDVVSWMDT